MNILDEITKFKNLFIIEQKAKNLSVNTISAYNNIFEKFYTFLVDESEINTKLSIIDINKYFLNNYLLLLKQNGFSDATRQLHITILKQLLWFIADYDDEKYGILRTKINGVNIKTTEKEVDAFTSIEQDKIISLINHLDKSKKFRNNRNSLVLKILLFHGVRISELTNLKWTDIEEVYDENEGYIYKFWYLGKGSKERDLDFPIKFVENNFEAIKKHIKSDYVVSGNTGNKCFRNSIYITIRKLLENQGIKAVWLHKFRHTFGHNKVNEGVNDNTITELMGHSDPATTAKFYLRSNKKAKNKAIFNGLPNNNIKLK